MPRTVATQRVGAWGDASDVLQLLLDRRSWTRAEIARTTSLSRSTIVLRLDALREAGLLRDAGQMSPEGGRPTSKVALNDAVVTVASIEIGHSAVHLAAADLSAIAYAEADLPIAQTDSFEQVLRGAVDRLRELIVDSDHGPLASVTLGLPLSAASSAVGLMAPGRQDGWASFPAREWLEDKLEVAVHVENDVNLMALGELNAAPDLRDVVLLHAGDGIGLGVICDGLLVRGSSGQAGEIAHVPALRRNDEPCICGNVGCVGAIATIPALLRMLREEGCAADDFDDVQQLIIRGDATAARLLRQAGRDVGDVLVYALATTNPQVLIIGGTMAVAGDFFVAGVKEALFTRGAPSVTEGLQVLRSSLPPGSVTAGALRLSAEYVLTGTHLFDLLSASAA